MNMMGYMVAKAMSEKGEHPWNIEDQNDTNMRTTCAKGLKTSLSPWYLQHSLKDETIGNTNGHNIYPNHKQGHCQPVSSVYCGFWAGQFYHSHMFTIGMAYDGGPAEDESLQQDREGEEEDQSPYQHCHPNAPYDPWMQDGRMVQRVTNGYIAIQSHSHKYTWLHGRERMDEEHLDQADSVPNLMGMNQEYRKGFGRSGGGQHQVNAREHGQKEVHRLVQGWVSPDDEDDAHIAHYSKKIKGTQWQCYPVLAFLQTGDAHQEKRRME